MRNVLRNNTLVNLGVPSIVLLLVVAVASAKPEPAKTSASAATAQSGHIDVIQYFSGESQATSTDGKTLYGPPRVMLLKRVISPSKNQITEDVIVGLERLSRTLTRVPNSDSFNFTAIPIIQKGTVAFKGKEWAWSSWSYAIDMFRMGSMKGTAQLHNDVLKIQFELFGPKGKATGMAKDVLKKVSASAYMAYLREWESKRTPFQMPFR